MWRGTRQGKRLDQGEDWSGNGREVSRRVFVSPAARRVRTAHVQQAHVAAAALHVAEDVQLIPMRAARTSCVSLSSSRRADAYEALGDHSRAKRDYECENGIGR